MRKSVDYTLEICIDFGYKRLNKKGKKVFKKEVYEKAETEVKKLIKDLLHNDVKPLKKDQLNSSSLFIFEEEDDEDLATPLRHYDYEDDEDHFYNKKPNSPIDHEDTDLL